MQSPRFHVALALSALAALVAGATAQAGTSSEPAGLLVGIAAVVLAATLALGGAAWYARRRWAS